jgi:hypothetical protein
VAFEEDEGETSTALGNVGADWNRSTEGEDFAWMRQTKHGTSTPTPRERGGAVFRPDRPGEVRLLTWNSADKERSASNTDHAEHHLVTWLEGVRNRWPFIAKVEVINEPFSPCSECAAELELVACQVIEARETAGRPGRPRFELHWEDPWDGPNRTQPHTLTEMDHWHVDPPQLPPTGNVDDDARLQMRLEDRARRTAPRPSAGSSAPVRRRRGTPTPA